MAVTLYWVVYADGGGTPTGAQIVAGQDSTGSAALDHDSEPYSGAGTYDEATAITSLSASTAYRVAGVPFDGTSYGTVVVSAAITTAAQLAAQDAAHGHTAGNVALSTGTALSINAAGHAHNADNIALSTGTALSINAAGHAHNADNIALSTT